MREMGLCSCMSVKFRMQTTDSNHDLLVAPNLLEQNFNVAESNRV